MGLMQRRKGRAHEQAVAREFRAVVPEAKRGYQARGGGKEAPDVEIPHLHLECKHKRTISIWAAIAQAVEDCPTGKLPAAVVRENRREDLVVMRLPDFVDLFGAVLRERAQRARVAACQVCMGRGTRRRVLVLTGGGEAYDDVTCEACGGLEGEARAKLAKLEAEAEAKAMDMIGRRPPRETR